MEIILVAIDNPASAVEWALAEMMIDPSLLDLASKELDEVVGRNRLVQESDLHQLNFIKACVKEAFRLHPVTVFNLLTGLRGCPAVKLGSTMVTMLLARLIQGFTCLHRLIPPLLISSRQILISYWLNH
ncbi:hypothetical protein SASPL_141092 [Salvia splendens]|uniref:Uncharacterized protein n=1 Tax=Salvia splendens TaxID=180675 RepID=A0A8X8ZC85_SALSN|nr:hypothetical protein SASPL_141092 [Salvia splendens]